MLLAVAALVGGILTLVLSADRFVEGAAVTAKFLGLPPLLIGILVIGFGSSMPEMVISALSAMEGNTGLALGNAYGSNIANIALILGTTAVLSPIVVGSSVVKRELPFLIAVTAILGLLFYYDGMLNRFDGIVLIVIFLLIMSWSIYTGLKTEKDDFADVVEQEFRDTVSLPRAIVNLTVGLVFLVISSRIMVWGGIEIAQTLGISDLIIGLTVVAVGTSLPELASSIAAVRKNEHELAIGNVIGSNLFNSSIVIGIAGTIAPSTLEPDIMLRDMPVLAVLTLLLLAMCYNFRDDGPGRINRFEGVFLLVAYVGYNCALVLSAMG